MTTSTPTGLPRWRLVTAIALPTLLVVGVLVAAVVLRSQPPGPLALVPVPAPEAETAECRALLDALPDELPTEELGTLDRRPIAEPVPPGTAAWGEPAVVLRCGINAPAELTPTSWLVTVSGVQWLELTGAGSSTWVVVDRPVFVALTLPEGAGSGPVQEIGEAVRTVLPHEPPFPR